MEIPVIIEPLQGAGYRVTGAGGLSVGLAAEGATADEALERLTGQIQSRLQAGAKMADLNVVTGEAPWRQDAGCLAGDPLFEPWLEAIRENRRQSDHEPDAR